MQRICENTGLPVSFMEDTLCVVRHLNLLITNSSKDVNKKVHRPSSDSPALLNE